MKVLVTGGAGFIGSHLTEYLLKVQTEVVVVDNLSAGLKENVPDNIKLIEMDVCDNGLNDVFAAEKFDAVVHLAGQTMVNTSIEAPLLDAQINIMGTVNVLECCRNNGVKRVVFAATAAAYGDCDAVPLEEKLVTEPLSFYGLSKKTIEMYLKLYHEYYGIEYAALRFANVYGERQGDGGEGGVISIFTKKIANDEPITINGDGGQTRDFIYAGDIAAAIYAALQAEEVHDVYNVSTNTEVSLNDMVDILRQVSGKTIEPKYGAARVGDIYRSILCNKKIKQAFGWVPQVALSEGLSRTYHYFADKKE